jgi:hypothetical protein
MLRVRFVSLSLLALSLAIVPAAAQTDLYDNGPINGTTSGWNIANGFTVSDTFTLSTSSTLTGLSFGIWLFPGDVLQGVGVQITSSEFGGTTYTSQMVNLTSSGCSLNQFGYNVCTESGTFGTGVNLAAGTYWLNLDNGVLPDDPAYWDENSGPSSASENTVGTIPSESFTLVGSSTSSSTSSGSSSPEPSSIMLFASGVLGVAGVLRRKLF